ncbi:hypothetical protein [Rhizorhabdus dicambivorans]|uniref:hypothetical protein n=1 Tax=Rhizorhabdus dicambivorans TaxID=1850238 RepID=UPI001EDE43EE|nr:hypothetical protein [Rhizorhabdus dicambivorans]
MQPPPAQGPSPGRHDLLRRRAIGMAAMAVVHILGFLLLLSLAPDMVRRIAPELKSFPLMSYSE